MKVWTEDELFIRAFFEQELYWLSNREYQLRCWSNANWDALGECLLVYTETWSIISEMRERFEISYTEYKMFDKLYEMILAFEIYIPEYPMRPSEYAAILRDPEWRKVQEYAYQIHCKIYPKDARKLGPLGPR